MTRRSRKPAELPTSIRLPMDLKKRLDQVARKQGARRAHLIIHILNEWLVVNSPPPAPLPSVETQAAFEQQGVAE